MKIEMWALVFSEKSPGMLYIEGEVHGHPKQPDGKEVVTSSIIGRHGELIVTTSGNEYELGVVNPVYERMFPNAKQRLFDRIDQLGCRLGGRHDSS